MKEFSVPALVDADPDANATDLLVERVKATPDQALFALPTADGGWSDVTSAEFHAQVIALAKGFVAAGIEPGDKIGLMCKTRYEWTLVDFATLVRRGGAGADLRDRRPGADPVEPHRLRRGRRSSPRRPTTSRASTRSAPTCPPCAASGRSTWATSTSSPRRAPESTTTRSSVAARSPRAATSRPSSTPRARRAGPRAASSPTPTSSSSTRNARARSRRSSTPSSSTLLFITLAHIFARFISVLASPAA